MSKQIILLTDFGIDSIYIAMMKSVISKISPDSTIIDLTHSVESHNIRQSAFILKATHKFFPKDSIFVTVVDPDVGTSRKIICIKFSDKYFISPDSGGLSWIPMDNDSLEIFDLNNEHYLPSKISNTFHGRDIIAHFAAHLANGFKLNELGHQIPIISVNSNLVIDSIIIENSIHGEIMLSDTFGNLVSNISEFEIAGFKQSAEIITKIGNSAISGIQSTYSDVQEGEYLAYIGSLGYLEVGVNKGRAIEKLNSKIGDDVIVMFK